MKEFDKESFEEGMKSERNRSKWIKMSDQLPPEKGEYITSTVYKQVYCDYWNGISWNRTEYILAWQPLPKPFTNFDGEVYE